MAPAWKELVASAGPHLTALLREASLALAAQEDGFPAASVNDWQTYHGHVAGAADALNRIIDRGNAALHSPT